MKGKKEISDESVEDIMDMWRNALEQSKCVARYTIVDKLIDYDLIPGTEFNCDECTSPFCFKKLQWDDGQEDEINKNGMSPPKILEIDILEINAVNIEIEEWERAYT